MRIAFFISSLSRGGSERVLVNLAEYFSGRGYEVSLVTQHKADREYTIGKGIERIFSEPAKEEQAKSRIRNFFRRFSKLRGIWKEKRPDLIVSFIGKNNVMAVLTSRLLHIPVVVCVRGEPSEEYHSRTLRLAAWASFRLADGIVLQTRESLDFFPRAVQKKAVILRNPLNPAFIRTPYQGEREKRIVAVGRVDANKNHEQLIRAFAAIAGSYPEYCLTVYGEGELRSGLVRLAKELGLSGRVSLPGAVSDVAAAVERAAVFVLPSFSEGMPNTLLEAMALGLAVIASDCPSGGPRALIEHGVNGLLIRPGDRKNLEENLQKLLDNPDYARKIGAAAAKVQEKYNPDIINAEWEDYLKGKICGGKR